MKKILRVFTFVVEQLNKRGVCPIIYGSLGLYLITGWPKKINDIDFIVQKPKDFVICKKILVENGFVVDPEHERELVKNNICVSFLDKEHIEKLISEPIILTSESIGKINFFNLDIEQYSKIYINGLKNKYRKEKKEKDDTKKINFIKKYTKSINT